MFLDEELELIVMREEDRQVRALKLITACVERLKNPADCSTKEFLNGLKAIDYSWKLFCKKHPEFNPDGFRNYFFRIKDEQDDAIKKELGW